MNESEKRRPGFTPGVPIVLCDGREWHLARPVMELVPAFGADGNVADATLRPAAGPGYDDKLERFLSAGGGLPELVALMDLAVALLSANYDLGPDDYRALLRFRKGDEANRAMWQRIAAVAQGVDDEGKPSPVGGGHP